MAPERGRPAVERRMVLQYTQGRLLGRTAAGVEVEVEVEEPAHT